MIRFALLSIAAMLPGGSVAQASSYKKTNGNIVDPIQPAITAVLLSAALVLLAALPSSAGIGDGRHLVRNLSNNGANKP